MILCPEIEKQKKDSPILRESYCMEMHTTLQQDRRGSFSCFCPCRHTRLYRTSLKVDRTCSYICETFDIRFSSLIQELYTKCNRQCFYWASLLKVIVMCITSSWYLLFFLLCFQKFLVNIMSDIGVHSIKWPVKVHCNFKTIWVYI